MEVHINIVGALLIMLATIHIIFPRYFNWKNELAGLSLINRQMMQVHTFFLAFILFLMGILCLSSASDLVSTSLGKRICLGFSIFWGLRLLFQFFIYSPKLWRGKVKETIIHILFTLLWIYFTLVFLFVSI